MENNGTNETAFTKMPKREMFMEDAFLSFLNDGRFPVYEATEETFQDIFEKATMMTDFQPEAHFRTIVGSEEALQLVISIYGIKSIPTLFFGGMKFTFIQCNPFKEKKIYVMDILDLDPRSSFIIEIK